MCAKMAKQKQTDYTKGGKLISDTSIPLYVNNLGRIDEYLADPQKRMNKYLADYYENTAAQSDFLTNYKRAMSGQTGLNYSATTGGYTSEGQRAYNDQQMHQNDLAARLRDQGVASAYNMANQDYQNMIGATNAYYNAYGLGKPYSDIDQYNYIRKQNNSFGNQAAGIGGQLASSAGKVFSSIPTPWTQAIGAGLQTVGGVAQGLTIDPSSSLQAAGLGGGASANTSGSGTSGGLFGGFGGIGRGLTATNALGGSNWITSLFGGR